MALTERQAARFLKRIDRTDGCWLWTGYISPSGYGRMSMCASETGSRQAHRIAYELWVGQIPEGLVIDHLCRNRRCVNPAHLEPVTCAENIRRGLTGQYVRTLAHNEKIAASKRGRPRPWTPEWKAKIAATRQQVADQRRGSKMTDEQRAKMREAWKRRKARAA